MPTVISNSTVGRRSSSSTSIVVRDPVTGRNVIVLKNIQDEDFRRLLSPFDTNGDGFIDEEELIRAATSSVVINEQTGKKVIVLADVEMDLQEYLGKFDINNDGEIDEEELIRAAKSYAETKQQNRFLKLAVAGVIGTSVIIIGSLSGVIHGVVHNEVEKSKDTEIQSGTGNLMVKTSSSTASDDTVVEVSTKSRGSFFMAEMISDDRNDGVLNSSNNKVGIVCVSADELEEMALSVMGGSTHTNFAVTDVNGNVQVHDLSQNGVVDWNENSVSLGSVTFAPSQGCGGVNEERKLDESDLTGLHTKLRTRVLSKIGLMGRGGDGGEKAMTLDNKDSNEAQLRLGGRKLVDEKVSKDFSYQAIQDSLNAIDSKLDEDVVQLLRDLPTIKETLENLVNVDPPSTNQVLECNEILSTVNEILATANGNRDVDIPSMNQDPDTTIQNLATETEENLPTINGRLNNIELVLENLAIATGTNDNSRYSTVNEKLDVLLAHSVTTSSLIQNGLYSDGQPMINEILSCNANEELATLILQSGGPNVVNVLFNRCAQYNTALRTEIVNYSLEYRNCMDLWRNGGGQCVESFDECLLSSGIGEYFLNEVLDLASTGLSLRNYCDEIQGRMSESNFLSCLTDALSSRSHPMGEECTYVSNQCKENLSNIQQTWYHTV